MTTSGMPEDLDRNYPQVWTTQVIVVYAMKSVRDDAHLCHDTEHIKFFLTSDTYLRDEVRGIVTDLYVKYKEMLERPYEAQVFSEMVSQLRVSEPGQAAEARYKRVLENIFVEEVNWTKIHMAIMLCGKYFYNSARLFDDERMKMILHWTIQYFMLPKIMNFIIEHGNWPLQTPGSSPSPRIEIQDLVKGYFGRGDDETTSTYDKPMEEVSLQDRVENFSPVKNGGSDIDSPTSSGNTVPSPTSSSPERISYPTGMSPKKSVNSQKSTSPKGARPKEPRNY